MTTTIDPAHSTTVLTISHRTSRGRETYGYNIVRLDDGTTGKRFRAMGGGYDMEGAVFGQWLQETYQERLQAIAGRAYYRYGVDPSNAANNRRASTSDAPDALYGMTLHQDTGRVTLDGACGIISMRHIADEIGVYTLRTRNQRGHTTGYVVTDHRT